MTIVITGGSKGIGFSIAEKFAEEGHGIILCARNENELRSASEELSGHFGIEANYFVADLALKTGSDSFNAWLKSNKYQVDILVNNCGTFIPGSIYNEEEGSLEKMMGINLYSAYNLSRLVLPQMIERKAGHIFNICSIASFTAYPNGGSYSISKFAMAGFSKNLREEMKPFNVKVTTVYPGAVFTRSWEGSGVDPKRIMEASDISTMILACSKLSPQACVEELVVRPQLGDL